jgi:membrane protein implicated in regulation of membrane protease activity
MLFLRAFSSIDWIMMATWVVIFIFTLIIELETMNLTTVWFCVSSVVTIICGVLFANPYVQVAIFVGLSIVLVLATRPLTKKMMQRDIIRTNTDRLIGMVAVVVKEIVPNEIGDVKVDNNLWRAINNDNLSFAVGEKVLIDAIVGIKLVVSKIDGNTNVEVL